MSTKYFFIVLIFFSCAWQQLSQSNASLSRNFHFSRSYLKNHHKVLQDHTEQRNGAALLYAIVTGNNKKISKQRLKSYKNMGIMHLLTPSGLHLGSLLWIQKFIPPKIFLVTLSLLTILFFNLSGFYPLKRIFIFKWLKEIRFLSSNELIFYATFIIDLLIGFYSKSPFSTLLSFLFWGTILTHKKYVDWSLAYKLGLGLMLVSLIFNQNLSALAFILNPLLSIAITIIFPFLILSFFLIPLSTSLAVLSSYFLEKIDQIIIFLDNDLLCFQVTIPAILIYLLAGAKNKLYFTIILCLFSSNLNVNWKLKVPTGKWMKPPKEIGRLHIVT